MPYPRTGWLSLAPCAPGANDALGRASRPRERESRISRDPAQALSFGRRRQSARGPSPASRFPARIGYAAACLLGLTLLLGAAPAQAQTSGTPPESATFLGTALTLTFDKGGAGITIVDTAPLVHGFTVDGLGSGSMHPNAVAMDNRKVRLELGMGAEPGKTVTVSYDPDMVPKTDPSPAFPEGRHNPLRYTDGTLVAAFSGVPVTILAQKPVTGLSVSFVSGRTVNVSWELPAQPAGVSVTAVEVHGKMTKPGVTEVPAFGSYGTAHLAADATSQTWPVMHGGFTHYFRVRLVTTAGNADSQLVSWSSDQELLQPATGLTASNVTQTTVDLAWTPPEQPAWVAQLPPDEVTSAVAQQEADGTWSKVAPLAVDAVAHTVTGLSAGTAYSFRIEHHDTTTIRYTEPVSVTTLAASNDLTASFHGLPDGHDGKRRFSFEIRFSEEFKGMRLPAFKAGALTVTGGRLIDVKRTTPGQNRSVTARVRPASDGKMTLTLAATTDCAAASAICTSTGRKLSGPVSATVAGPGNSAATGAPAISGEARAGKTLTATTSGISDADGLSGATFAFQWVSSSDGADSDIAGATGSSYTLADSDVGAAIKVRASFTDDAGNSEELTSAPTAAVAAVAQSNAAATGAPAISGVARAGGTLTATTSGISDADGLSGATFAFQWVSSSDGADSDIAGATGSSYTLADSDVGATIKVRASFTDDAGNSEELTSPATATVEPRPNSPATGAPAITGVARAGETLTATTGGISDADGLSGATFAFQWVSSADGTDSDIAGATGSSYSLGDGDVGATIKVRASFTDDAGHSEELTSAATATVERRPLTAEFQGMPAEHDGRRLFSFELVFSENFPGKFPYTTLRDSAFTVTNGRVRGAERVVKGENRRWRIKVRPSSSDDVSITLAAGAVSTASGRPLSNTVSAQIAGPVGVSVADARVEEGAGAVLAFAVSLSRAATSAFSVDYATSDGSARAGEDYTAASGTLSFQAGESSRTVEVAVLDDAHDEGEETLTLRLSNASSGRLTDGEATGTIENTDLMPAALLARFGRATAEQVVTHIEERMAAPRRRGFRARFAGRELQPGSEGDFALGFLSSFAQPMGVGPAGAVPMGGAAPMGMGSHAAGVGAFGAGTAGMGGAMGMSGATRMGVNGRPGMGGGAMGMAGQHAPMGGAAGPAGYGPAGGMHGGSLFGSMAPGGNLFSDSEFELNRESRGGILSVWSSSSRSYFSGMEDALSLDGDVRTTMIGADYSRGDLTVGLSVGRTAGLGGYKGPSGGRMSTSMTGFYPWVGYQVNDQVSVWGVTGYGTGALSLTPDGASALETGVSMAMSAVGTRGELIGSRATGGFALAFKADALWVGAVSELLDGAAGRLNASEAGVTRVRTALEGSRGFTLGGGRLSLTPSVEVGLRRDGGDAETGAGMDVGSGLAFTDAVTGLSLDVRVWTLVIHQAEGFSERGMSLSFGWDPTPSSPLGVCAAGRLRQEMGRQPTP